MSYGNGEEVNNEEEIRVRHQEEDCDEEDDGKEEVRHFEEVAPGDPYRLQAKAANPLGCGRPFFVEDLFEVTCPLALQPSLVWVYSAETPWFCHGCKEVPFNLKVGFIQSSPEFGAVGANVDSAVKKLADLARKGALLVVLPELFNTGYQFRSGKEAASLSEAVPSGPTTRRLIEVARLHRLYIVFGIAERAGRRVGQRSSQKLYNSAVLVGPEGYMARYRKAHLFLNESKWFSPGNTPFEVHDIGVARIGMLVCFDWIFPEAARTLALKGADILCHPSNLVLPHCPEAMKTRALENGVFAITANRVGIEARLSGERLRFIGLSQVVSPEGKVLVRAPGARVYSKVVSIDVLRARKKKITPRNDLLGDRRTDLYFR